MANDTNTQSFRFARAQSAYEGRDHREMDHRWARAIRDRCKRDDVAFFKQSAGRQPEQGQVEANLARTAYRELTDLSAVTQAARNGQTPATDEPGGVST